MKKKIDLGNIIVGVCKYKEKYYNSHNLFLSSQSHKTNERKLN